MKPLKAVVKRMYSEHSEIDILIRFTGTYNTEVKKQIDKLNLSAGSVFNLKLLTEAEVTGKTVKQNNTFHMLLLLLWKSGCASDSNYDALKIRIKHNFGVPGDYQLIEGLNGHLSQPIFMIKSFAKYNLKEGAKLIDNLIIYMDDLFRESAHSDKRFDEMVNEWRTE